MKWKTKLKMSELNAMVYKCENIYKKNNQNDHTLLRMLNGNEKKNRESESLRSNEMRILVETIRKSTYAF